MAALEAKKIGSGGTKQLRAITGLDINTIRRGREEMEEGLVNRPTQRIRVVWGGRKGVEKSSWGRSRSTTGSGKRNSRRPMQCQQMDSSKP
jgi:hypothetical protein